MAFGQNIPMSGGPVCSLHSIRRAECGALQRTSTGAATASSRRGLQSLDQRRTTWHSRARCGISLQHRRPNPAPRMVCACSPRRQGWRTFHHTEPDIQFQRSGTPRTRMARGLNSARRESALLCQGRGVLAEALQWKTTRSVSGSRVARPSTCLGK